MAASLQAAATLMTPAKLRYSPSTSLRSSPAICKSFGVDPTAGARLTCSLAQRCAEAAKLAGFALAASAVVVSVSPPLH